MPNITDIINIGATVAKALQDEAAKKSNDLTAKDAEKIEPAVTAKVEAATKKEVGSVIQNLENREPWYQSRVIIGTAIAIIAQVAGFAGHRLELVDQEAITNLAIEAVTLLGALYAMYGRLVTNKPIGE